MTIRITDTDNGLYHPDYGHFKIELNNGGVCCYSDNPGEAVRQRFPYFVYIIPCAAIKEATKFSTAINAGIYMFTNKDSHQNGGRGTIYIKDAQYGAGWAKQMIEDYASQPGEWHPRETDICVAFTTGQQTWYAGAKKEYTDTNHIKDVLYHMVKAAGKYDFISTEDPIEEDVKYDTNLKDFAGIVKFLIKSLNERSNIDCQVF